MPASSKFYTTAAMRRPEVEAVTSEATGHPIEMAFDWNPDTYWAPTSTASNTIDIDLQDAYDIDGLALFVRNYDTDFVAETVALYYSDNGTSWTLADSWTLMTYGAAGEPLKVFPAITEDAHRWWRIVFGGTITQVVNIAQVILYNATTIGQGNEEPEDDDQEIRLTLASLAGGMTMKDRTNRIVLRRFVRTWQFVLEADFVGLRQVVDDSLGAGRPLILEESGSVYLVEIVDTDFDQAKSAPGSYKPTVTFATIPYNEDGAGY